MSVNRYDPNTGTLTTLAGGSRIWVGTKAQHDAAVQAGTLPNNCLISITDDDEDSLAKDVVYENAESGLEADNVQDAIDEVASINEFTISSTDWVTNTNTRNNTTYTVMQEIETDAFDNTSADATLDGYIISATAGEVMTEAELTDSYKISHDCIKSANGFYVYATEQTTVDLRLKVKGK